MCTWFDGLVPQALARLETASAEETAEPCPVCVYVSGEAVRMTPLTTARCITSLVLIGIINRQISELEERGTDRDHQQRWQDEESERQQDLDGQLAGSLLGALAALRTQQVGVRAKRLRHAGAEPVALDDEGDKRLKSSEPLRAPSARSASARVRPWRSSRATCANSAPMMSATSSAPRPPWRWSR